jgi:hypothetical protein
VLRISSAVNPFASSAPSSFSGDFVYAVTSTEVQGTGGGVYMHLTGPTPPASLPTLYQRELEVRVIPSLNRAVFLHLTSEGMEVMATFPAGLTGNPSSFRTRLTVQGQHLTLEVNGAVVGSVDDPSYAPGTVVYGITLLDEHGYQIADAPYAVGFSDIFFMNTPPVSAQRPF